MLMQIPAQVQGPSLGVRTADGCWMLGRNIIGCAPFFVVYSLSFISHSLFFTLLFNGHVKYWIVEYFSSKISIQHWKLNCTMHYEYRPKSDSLLLIPSGHPFISSVWCCVETLYFDDNFTLAKLPLFFTSSSLSWPYFLFNILLHICNCISFPHYPG